MQPLRVFVSCSAILLMVTAAAGEQNHESIFRNTDRAVAFTGSASCVVAGCHQEIGRAYAPSPHGQSMAPANRAEELTRVPHPFTVFNPRNNRTYAVYQENGQLFQSVTEKNKRGQTLYTARHQMDYVVGGDRTGYSYLFRVGGWLFQAPLSYYAPSKTWELSPGYAADDPGFTRGMTTGCLVCHNGQPDPVAGRDGLYKDPPFRFAELGIGCEACHGPGALHVQQMRAHKGSVLRANEVDTSIVNPAKLSPRLADDICRLCHQAGDAVVNLPGRSDTDFRPGMELAETMAIFRIPIQQSQRAEADRLEKAPPIRGSLEQPLWWKNSTMELSRCYTASHGKLTCTTCHSIHHAAAPGQEKAGYRAACLTCHTATSCSLPPSAPERLAKGDYCVACHMEKRPVAGIAHSNDTKHRIVRYPGQPLPDVAFQQPRADLPGLLWTNRPADGWPLPAETQLAAYWTAARKAPSLWPLWLGKLNELKKSHTDDPAVLTSLGAWAMAEKHDYADASADFDGALHAGATDPSTFLNLAAALHAMNRDTEAESVLARGVEMYPWDGSMVVQWAAQCIAMGQGWKARDALAKYASVFPEDAAAREALRRVQSQADANLGASRGSPVASPK